MYTASTFILVCVCVGDDSLRRSAILPRRWKDTSSRCREVPVFAAGPCCVCREGGVTWRRWHLITEPWWARQQLCPSVWRESPNQLEWDQLRPIKVEDYSRQDVTATRHSDLSAPPPPPDALHAPRPRRAARCGTRRHTWARTLLLNFRSHSVWHRGIIIGPL